MLPDERLRTAAELVRQGAVFADIGTDHAYLPVFLCETERIVRAVAADIGEGPLAVAREHISARGLSHRIRTHLADGLTGLENEGLTDIAICGMGGELIVQILSAAPFIRDEGIRLILQPMTHAADLRYYLAREGFAITEERLARAAGKYYFCFAASFTGKPNFIDRLTAEMGKGNENSPYYATVLRQKIASQEKKCAGLALGGLPDEEELAYLDALRRKETETLD